MMPRKQELVAAAIGYLAERGIADLSLRPLAAATGTSARLLIYHFGSKERLLAEVLAALQSRLRDSFSEVLAARAAGQGEAPIMIFWKCGDRTAEFRLLEAALRAADPGGAESAELCALPQAQLAGLDRAGADGSARPTERSAALATLLVAVFDGLFLELMSTGDRRANQRRTR